VRDEHSRHRLRARSDEVRTILEVVSSCDPGFELGWEAGSATAAPAFSAGLRNARQRLRILRLATNNARRQLHRLAAVF